MSQWAKATVFALLWIAGCGDDSPAADSTTGGAGGFGAGASTGGQTSGGAGGEGIGGTLNVGGSPIGCEGGCADDEYCEYFGDSCGAPQFGRCASASGCVNQGPVCTCMGTVELSDCDAYAAGLDLSVDAACETPADTFRCGGLFCEDQNEVCLEKNGLTTGFECSLTPEGCTAGALTCECAVELACACEELPDGNLKVTCTSS